MTEDEWTLGTIEGTATFDYVEVAPGGENTTEVVVIGSYQGDTTKYKTDRSRVSIGGMEIRGIFDTIQLDPADGENWVWVEATEEELRITAEEPSD